MYKPLSKRSLKIFIENVFIFTKEHRINLYSESCYIRRFTFPDNFNILIRL